MKKNYIGTYGVMKNESKLEDVLFRCPKNIPIFTSILKCIEEKENSLKVLIIGKNENEIAVVRKEVYKEIEKPKFFVGDKVKLFKYPDEKAVVRDIEWHEKDERIIYYLNVEGDKRKSNSRYYEDENKFEKINE